ncbi:hypothetical protein ACGF13_25000 [Kitasatospora sp. NPDC048286]|uniref:hypothetical protein n=1 Tax=Kitasatospora sp. NPDC048286 TaxID=3364047 RepID=UPI00371CDFE1
MPRVRPPASARPLLTNHTTPTDRLNRTKSPASDETPLADPGSTAARLHWRFVAVAQ